jgi:hypothetical protein
LEQRRERRVPSQPAQRQAAGLKGCRTPSNPFNFCTHCPFAPPRAPAARAPASTVAGPLRARGDAQSHRHAPLLQVMREAAAPRRRRGVHAGVASWLARRECGCPGRALLGAPYAAAPPRLRVPITRLLDAARALLRCILLGFSRDGEHLLSYSQRSGAYALHVFRFRAGAPATLVAVVPLFRVPRAHAAPRDAALGGLFGAAAVLAAAVCRSPLRMAR